MLHRSELERLAQGLEPAVVSGIVEHLEPLERALAEIDPAQLLDEEPAVAFDPQAAAGGPQPRRSLPEPPPAAVPDLPAADELPWAPLAELTELVRSGRLDPPDLVAVYAARLDALQPRLNVVITPTVETARAEAAAAPRGKLAGAPLGLKDLIATAGVRTTAGSRILAERVPDADAPCWRRLHAAGALCLAKLNTHEFAAGATNENPHWGDVRNPWDESRVSGGSSGGSAAAVAAALVAAALGTDTGGSIRIPAACCGVVGLKPTYGRVPRGGVVPLSWSLDHVGPLARRVRDAALLLDVLSGSADCEPAARAGAAHGLGGWRIGVPRNWLDDRRLQPAVAEAFEAALQALRGAGAEVVDLELDGPRMMAPLNRVIAYAEATAWHTAFLPTRSTEYGENVRARMEAGRFIWATDYLLAQRLRSAVCRRFSAAWQQVDLLATPTLPAVAPPRGTPNASALLIRYTAPFNVLGLPAISLPCGFGEGGMPVGLQLVAPADGDDLACYAAAAFEAATDWHRRRPPV